MYGWRIDTTTWDFPAKRDSGGEYVRLEPLSQGHCHDLWPLAQAAPDSFAYLRYGPFTNQASLAKLIADLSSRVDQPFWAVIAKNGRAQGWLSICDVYQSDGALEIGSIWFAPVLQGTRAAREAVFMLMSLGMDALGYERLVWRCQAQNAKSVRAAVSLGFQHEGTWRNAAVVDGWQRDVAWFSILQNEWPARRDALKRWLQADKFDTDGHQRVRLQDMCG